MIALSRVFDSLEESLGEMGEKRHFERPLCHELGGWIAHGALLVKHSSWNNEKFIFVCPYLFDELIRLDVPWCTLLQPFS